MQEKDNEYHAAVDAGNWPDAAEWLNGFNYVDIQLRLASLTPGQVSSLHQGAIDNPNVGPQAQVALMTAPGTPQASTMPPVSSPVPPKAATQQDAPRSIRHAPNLYAERCEWRS